MTSAVAATALTAARGAMPSACRARTRATNSSMLALPCAAGAPATTNVSSPRRSAAPAASAPRLAAQVLLVQLGQFAAKHGRPIGATDVGEILQVRLGSVGRHEHDHGPRLGRQLRQSIPSTRALARQEPLEGEPIARQARGHQGGEHGRRSWHRFDVVTGGDRGRDQAVARIRHRRCPGIRHEHHAVTGAQSLEHRRHLRPLVVVVQRPLGCAGVDLGQQAAGPSRVLGTDQVGIHQRGRSPWAEVAKVPDRRGNHDQPAHARLRLPPRRPHAGPMADACAQR